MPECSGRCSAVGLTPRSWRGGEQLSWSHDFCAVQQKCKWTSIWEGILVRSDSEIWKSSFVPLPETKYILVEGVRSSKTGFTEFLVITCSYFLSLSFCHAANDALIVVLIGVKQISRRGRPRWKQTLHRLASPLCLKKSNSCDTWHVTCDTWHVTCDTWHMTHGMWHMTRDMLNMEGGEHCLKMSSL